MTIELIKKLDIIESNCDNLLFLGGRPDNNTNERIRGFKEANRQAGINFCDDQILICGYAAQKVQDALDHYFKENGAIPSGVLVNSTISLEGVMNWFHKKEPELLQQLSFGCFDWDPFAAMIRPDIIMVRQNVNKMVNTLFDLMDDDTVENDVLIQIEPSLLVP